MTTLDSSQWMYSSGAGNFYSHTIDQSLRFEDGDNPNLSKSWSTTASSTTAGTFSAWVKRGNLGITTMLLSAHLPSPLNASAYIYFDTTDQLRVYLDSSQSGSDEVTISTTALFRDVSSWYHIVVEYNVSESTTTDKAKVYVNGTQQTTTAVTTGSAVTVLRVVTSGLTTKIGQSYNTSFDFDGYIAELHYVDGQSLDPTSFGETKAGIWIPKDYTGSYGNNGFKFTFADSSALGDDTSGNGNDFTASGLASTDVVLDSPINNFVTLNPTYAFRSGSANYFAPTLLEGNLKADYSSSSGAVFAASTLFADSGKWYAEVRSFAGFGWVGISHFTNSTTSSGYAILLEDGSKNYNGTSVSAVDTVSDGDIIGIALDLDSGTIEFFINNSSQTQRDISSFTGSGKFFGFGVYLSGTDNLVQYNFGQDSSFSGAETAQGNADSNGVGDFYYSPPSGFLAPCTANLPNPAIDPAEDEEPADHFNTVLYSGDGSSSQSITGVGFEPAWTWIKSRGNAYAWHALIDSVRGVTKFLYSNVYNTEATSSAPFKSFNIDGFSVGSDTSTARTNVSGETYVAWNWLASTSVSGSTSGAGTSKSYSGKSNTTSGFSIIAYSGNGTNGHDVPHHLGVKPEMIITKSRNYSYDWMIYHKDIPTTYSHPPYIEWNETAAAVTSSQMFEEPTSSYMGLYSNGAINRNGGNHISYCFASKDGYSRVGSYTGNGSTDGPFVYTGFRVAWLMIKRTNSTADWIVFDSKRDVDNEITQFLYPNASYAEATGSGVLDFLSNGFKLRGSTANRNASGSHYIFLCFAEQPFKYSNAR